MLRRIISLSGLLVLAPLAATGCKAGVGSTCDGTDDCMSGLVCDPTSSTCIDPNAGTDATAGTDAAPGSDAASGSDAMSGTDAITGTDAAGGTDAAMGTDAAGGTDSAVASDAGPCAEVDETGTNWTLNINTFGNPPTVCTGVIINVVTGALVLDAVSAMCTALWFPLTASFTDFTYTPPTFDISDGVITIDCHDHLIGAFSDNCNASGTVENIGATCNGVTGTFTLSR